MIIGGGVAGLSAAVYAARGGLDTLLLEAVACGGQLLGTDRIDNYPALPHAEGWQVGQALEKQARESGAEIRFEMGVSLGQNDALTVETDRATYHTKTVIIANGAVRKKIGCPGEGAYAGRGVSYCATCDGAFFRDGVVAVVGGGNAALTEARYLASLCRKVYLIVRREQFSAEAAEVQSTLALPNIEPLMGRTVSEIWGDHKVQGVSLLHREHGSRTLALDAVFVAVGYRPDNRLFERLVRLDADGYVAAGEDCLTTHPAVFAAGDTRRKVLRQMVTAAADGAMAATQAIRYLRQATGSRRETAGAALPV